MFVIFLVELTLSGDNVIFGKNYTEINIQVAIQNV